MNWKEHLRSRLDARGLDPTRHFTVIEELAQHLDDRYRSLLARGSAPEAAVSSVLQELDDEALERELKRAERRAGGDRSVLGDLPRPGIVAGWRQDLQYAARALTRSPGFTLVAAATLALGIGANTAIFSILNAVMLRPFPYQEPSRLVRMWESNIARGWPQFSVSQPNFLDFRAQSTLLEAMAAIGGTGFTLTTPQGAELVRGIAVTADFLPVLGIPPARGRNFLPEEDKPGGNGRVAILTGGFWNRRFGSDPSIVGKTIPLDGADYEVVGVLPPTFQWGTADLLVPLAPSPAAPRGDHRLTVIGRLRGGATIQQAESELVTIASALGERYPESNKGWSVTLASFYDWLIPESTRESLIILLGAVAGLLLIACTNVASLLLARGAVRQKELSIRIAIGAERWRIVRQLLTESLLLGIVACLAGLALGAATTRLLVAYGPASVPRLDEASLDLNVILFAIAVSLVTVFVFGLVPAIQVSRQQPSHTLQHATRGAAGGAARQRLRSTLTVAQLALSVALLIGAGLLLRSFSQLQRVEPGFDVQSLMIARVALPENGYSTNQARIAFHDRLLSGVQALPGIVSAATGSGLPLTAGNTSTELQVPGVDLPNGGRPSASWRIVSPGYFKTLGIPLRGADFTPQGADEALRTTIVSEALAREYWPNQDALGRMVRPQSLGNRERNIIGVAGDVRSFGLDTEPPRIVYISTAQYIWNPIQLVWRGAGDPAAHVGAIRDLIRRLDPTVPVYDVRSLNDLLDDSFGPRRFNMYLLGCFAVIALLLAAIGLFGVMAYLVSQRTQEIGVRLALGAARADVFKLVVGRGVVLAVLGAGIGVAGAFWLTRLMQSLLFSISPSDPATFALVPVLLVVVALLACYIPARRAMRVNPVTALRIIE